MAKPPGPPRNGNYPTGRHNGTYRERRRTLSPYEWHDGIERDALPIDEHLTDFLETLKNNQVVVFQGATGSGKTTRLGQSIVDHDPDAKVIMTELHRPAVRFAGRAIASEMGERPGQTIGWQLSREDPVISDQTRMTIRIDQSIINDIRRRGGLPEGVIIIDEAHERTIQTDLLLGLIKMHLPNSPNTKIVITSATIDTEKFSRFFDQAPIKEVPGRVHPVEVREFNLDYAEHHTDGAIRASRETLGSFARGELTVIDPAESERLMELTKQAERDIPDPNARELYLQNAYKEALHTNVQEGTILVLLPGKQEIQEAIRQINAHAKTLGISSRVEALACHSETTRDEQDRLLDSPPSGSIRFVCATEIVRSSVTIPSVVGVIDSLQIKRFFTEPNGVTHLTKISVSQAEADQGRGRAGRVSPGFYIPVSYKNEYTKRSLERWPTPAVNREPLTSIALQVAANRLMDPRDPSGEKPLNIRDFPFIDPLPAKQLEVAIDKLKKVGALDDQENITEKGEKMVNIPVKPELASTILEAERLGVLPETMIAAAVIDNENIFFRPRSDSDRSTIVSEEVVRNYLFINSSEIYDSAIPGFRKRKPDEFNLPKDLPYWIKAVGSSYEVADRDAQKIADTTRQMFAEGTNSDYVACVNAVRSYKDEERRLIDETNEGSFRGDPERYINRGLDIWCSQHFLNGKKMGLVDTSLTQLVEDLRNIGITPTDMDGRRVRVSQKREFDPTALTKALAAGLTDNVCRSESRGNYSGPMGNSIQLAFGSTCPQESGLILIGGVHKIPGKRGTEVHLADMAAPVEFAWLQEVMPQHCSARIIPSSYRYDPTSGAVLANQEQFYGVAKIRTESINIRDEKATQVFVEALCNRSTGHPCEKPNQVYVDEYRNLGLREKKFQNLKDLLREWYLRQLHGACTRAEADAIDLFLNDAIVSDLIGDNYAEYRELVTMEYPNTLTVLRSPCPVEYRDLFGREVGVQITIPLNILPRLTAADIPRLTGHDRYTIAVTDGFGNTYSKPPEQLDELRAEVDRNRQNDEWRKFKEAGHSDYSIKVVTNFGSPLPELPQPEIWDPQNDTLAYPAHTYSSSTHGEGAYYTCYIRWFRTEKEAQTAQATTAAEIEKFNAEENDRRQFTERLAAAEALYAEVSSLLAQIDRNQADLAGLTYDEANNWSTSSLWNRLQNVRNRLDYKSYQSTQVSAQMAELAALKLRIEQALAQIKDNETLAQECIPLDEAVDALEPELKQAWRRNDIEYEEYNAAQLLISQYRSRRREHKVREALVIGQQIRELDIGKRVREKQERIARVEALRESDFRKCPVCGEDTFRDNWDHHYCQSPEDHRDLLVFVQGEHAVLKELYAASEPEQPLIQIYGEPYGNNECRLTMRYVPDNVPFKPDERLIIADHWKRPEPWQASIATETRHIHERLAQITRERQYSGRIELTLVIGKRPDGSPQLCAYGNYTGTIDRKKREGGNEKVTYTNRRVLFVVNDRQWTNMDTPPQVGETWLFTTAFQIGVNREGLPIILVNPTTRTDDEEALRTRLEELKTANKPAAQPTSKAGEMTKSVDKSTDDESPEDDDDTTDLAAMLAEHFGQDTTRRRR